MLGETRVHCSSCGMLVGTMVIISTKVALCKNCIKEYGETCKFQFQSIDNFINTKKKFPSFFIQE